MPAFGDVLTDDQIQQTITYVRSLCTDRTWPRGELNLPRPLVTEKAFPENETVFSTTIARGDSATVETEVLYERRIGARMHLKRRCPSQFRRM